VLALLQALSLDLFRKPMTLLPDPHRHPEFYDGVLVKRALAWVIDLFVILLLTLPLLVLTGFLALFVIGGVYLIVGFFYRWATIAGASATYGMRIMAIELRDAQGNRFDSGQAMLHTLGFTVQQTIAPLQLVSIACMVLTERGQSLTDLAMGSTMLNRRAI
jgi:uncharacterized RDD family membrane protein YckC